MTLKKRDIDWGEQGEHRITREEKRDRRRVGIGEKTN